MDAPEKTSTSALSLNWLTVGISRILMTQFSSHPEGYNVMIRAIIDASQSLYMILNH